TEHVDRGSIDASRLATLMDQDPKGRKLPRKTTCDRVDVARRVALEPPRARAVHARFASGHDDQHTRSGLARRGWRLRSQVADRRNLADGSRGDPPLPRPANPVGEPPLDPLAGWASKEKTHASPTVGRRDDPSGKRAVSIACPYRPAASVGSTSVPTRAGAPRNERKSMHAPKRCAGGFLGNVVLRPQ